ncbi:MAG: TrkA family potassium uptake protein [Eubacterium sp.]|nr:TrkA family potassium uptake protein [Eubacterium sp.]
MNKSIAVFGIGRFGKSLALRLADMGVDVMVVDNNPEDIEKIADKVTYAIEANLTDADAIQALGLDDIDTVVVAMGSDLQASIMSVMVAKEMGVPYVMAKASDERMGAILTKVGADKIIYPEEESGFRTARVLASESFIDYFDIAGTLCVLEMKPKPEWIGKNLIELNLRGNYKMNVIAIKDKSGTSSYIDPNKPLDADAELFVVVDKKDLHNIR